MVKTGFSFSKLPYKDKNDEHSIDYAVLNFAVDRFTEKGGNFFETSYTYCGGKSEEAIRLSVTERCKRDSFILMDKLPGWMMNGKADSEKLFEKQLSRCGVGYFDYYIIDWLNEVNYITAQSAGEFLFLEEMKKEGKIRKSGFSFYGSPEFLERILNSHPEIDAVRLEVNFLNMNSPVYRTGELCEIIKRHGKEIIAANALSGKSIPDVPENLPLRFVKNLCGIKTVLCEFEDPDRMDPALSEDMPLSDDEMLILEKAADAFRSQKAVECIGCGECEKVCPLVIPVPEYFMVYNEYSRNPEDDWKMEHAYSFLTGNFSRPSDCLRCRICEQTCPQKINIADSLRLVSRTFGY